MSSPRRRGRPGLKALRAAAPVLLLTLLASGCTALGTQADDGSQQSFVAGDGTWELVSEADRTEPVALSGPASDGSVIDVSTWRGQVVVVNVWYAACAPCRIEAPDLAAAAQDYAGSGVQFVGLNTRDGAAAAKAFEREFAIPYPSVMDAASGQALLALRGVVPPAAVPSTIVLDRQGRPAGRIVGRADPGVLRGMIDEVAGGPATPTPPTGARPGAARDDSGEQDLSEASSPFWRSSPEARPTRLTSPALAGDSPATGQP